MNRVKAFVWSPAYYEACVPSKRLLESLLRHGARVRSALVSPAGSGKSAMVAAYARLNLLKNALSHLTYSDVYGRSDIYSPGVVILSDTLRHMLEPMSYLHLHRLDEVEGEGLILMEECLIIIDDNKPTCTLAYGELGRLRSTAGLRCGGPLRDMRFVDIACGLFQGISASRTIRLWQEFLTCAMSEGRRLSGCQTKFVLVNVLEVTDPEGDPVSVTIDSIGQDEPVDTVGDGSFSPNGQGVGTDTGANNSEADGVPGGWEVDNFLDPTVTTPRVTRPKMACPMQRISTQAMWKAVDLLNNSYGTVNGWVQKADERALLLVYFDYDDNGNVIATVNHLCYPWIAAGHHACVLDSRGDFTECGCDAISQPIRVFDPRWALTHYGFDGFCAFCHHFATRLGLHLRQQQQRDHNKCEHQLGCFSLSRHCSATSVTGSANCLSCFLTPNRQILTLSR